MNKRLRVFFMDEARFGQQGTTMRVWAPRGSRPTAVKQTRYEWVYLYAAVEPATGHSVALQAPHVDTSTMSVFLRMVSEDLGASDHAVLIMDQAGWHRAKALKLPENITILYLPPYSPELNPGENLWGYLRSHYLSNRVLDDYQHLLDAGAAAWQSLTPETLRSVCACHYLTHEKSSRSVSHGDVTVRPRSTGHGDHAVRDCRCRLPPALATATLHKSRVGGKGVSHPRSSHPGRSRTPLDLSPRPCP